MGWLESLVARRGGGSVSAMPVESLVVATGLRLFLVGASTTLGLTIALFGKPRELALSNEMELETRALLIALGFLGGVLSSGAGGCFVLFSRRANRLRELHLVSRLC